MAHQNLSACTARPEARRYRIGGWSFDGTTNRLRRDEEEVTLEPKVCDVLLVLAERAGEPIPRTELQERVWQSEHISEDLPRRAIYELRKVFDDDPRNPTYIETVPRRGYRLVADVEPLVEAPSGCSVTARAPEDVTAESAPPGPPEPPHTHGILPWAAAAALLVFLSLGVFMGLQGGGFAGTAEGGSAGLFDGASSVPLTSSPGLELSPAFSPDGTRIAYLNVADFNDAGSSSLQILVPGDASSLQVTHRDPGDRYLVGDPTWSPDGTMLAYLRQRDGRAWIYQVSALGGAERPICDLGTLTAHGLSWSPDGRYFAVGLESDDGVKSIHRIDAESLQREQVTFPGEAILGDHSPVWSPDGSSIAYLRSLANLMAREVRVLDLSSGEERSLLPEPGLVRDMDWTPDSGHLVMSVFEGGRYQLQTVAVSVGGARRTVTPFGENAPSLSIARNSRRLTYSSRRMDVSIWRYDLQTGEGHPAPSLSSTHFDAALSLDPAGERVALASTRSGQFEIWLLDLAGRPPIQLTSFEGPTLGHPRWSPDGAHIVFDSVDQRASDVWRIGSDGLGLERLTDSSSDDRAPSWSVDGGSLYFASNRSGTWQIWRLSQEDGWAGDRARQITTSGGFYAQEAKDGTLYYGRWQTAGLWRLTGDGREEQVLQDWPAAEDWGNWFFYDQGIAHLRKDKATGRNYLAHSPLSGAPHRELVDLEVGSLVAPSIAPSPDRQWFLIGRIDRIRSDLSLVEGW